MFCKTSARTVFSTMSERIPDAIICRMETVPDEDLIRQWQEADPRTAGPILDTLFQRHYGRVHSWCLRLAGDPETAAEWAQEVFLIAYQNLRGFRGDSKFSTWLYRIARNYCLSSIRARASQPQPSAPCLDNIPDTAAIDSLQELEREGAALTLQSLMRESLTQVESEVLILHYVEGLGLEAVTRRLGLANASGAKAYVVSARRKLQQAILKRDGGSRPSRS